MRQDDFRNPPAEYRVHPFWFWNGDMQEERIRFQISEMADKGIGGFFLCARQGMKLPYLSDAWFTTVKIAIEVAKEYGIHVWLYDEYPYPSGIAGGEVILQHPDAKHRILRHKGYTVLGNSRIIQDLPWGKVISAIATPIDSTSGARLWNESLDIRSAIGNHQVQTVFQKTGLTNYNQKRFFTYETIKQLQWEAPVGQWELDVFVETEIDDFKYYGTFVDPGHVEAMKTFIQVTHERYKKEIGQYFGDVVKGMFTDEIGYLGDYPWSSYLSEKFSEMHGYAVENVLQALVHNDYDDVEKVRYDYFQALHVLLRESYHKQVHDWCEENGLQYVAEVPSMRMTTQLYSHVVGSDSAHDKVGNSLECSIKQYYGNFRSNPKMTSSLSLQLNKPRALVECFHSIGWSMTLQDAKWMIDRMAAMGVNFYNFHAFFYTLDGLTKHDAPPSQFYQNPYWQHFRMLGDYVGRISFVMTQGTPLHSVALLDPTTSMWTHLGNPLHGFQYIGNDDAERQRLERLKEDWTNLGTELLLQQIGYDHLDPELLKEAHVGDGRILIGGATYSTMILPPIVNLERAAWEKITEFLDKGGIVIAVGLLPYEHIEDDPLDENEILQVFNVPTSPATDYWRVARDTGVGLSEKFYEGTQQKAYFVPSFHYSDDACRTVSRLVSRLEPQVVVIDDERAKRSILVECRLVEESYLIFIANQDQTKLAIPIRIDLRKLRTHDTLSKQPSIERLNLETGHSTRIRAIMDGDMSLLPIEFHPYESCLIKVSFEVDDQDPQMELRQETPYKLEVSTDQPWIVTPDNPNVLRFDEFKLMLGTDDGWSQPSTVQVKTFIDQCSDIHATQTLPIHFSQVFGTPMQLGMDYPIRCKYTVDFNVAYTPKLCELFMDRGAISGDYFITFNGHKIEPCDFHPKFFYDHANIACPVDGFLREGRNTIEIEVQINRDWDGLVDAIYLAGDFGVAFDESRVSVITTAAREAALCSGPLPSYPFYSGTLSFKRSFTLNQKLDSSNFVLEFPDLSPDFHDCAEVILNGNSLGVCPWSPYQWRGRTNLLQAGANELEVKVTNTLVGTLEGRYFDYQAHQLREVEDVHHRD